MFKEKYINDNQIINPDEALIDRISAQMAEQIKLNSSGRAIPFGNVTKILACAACACLVIGAAILLPNMSGIKTADTAATTTTAAAIKAETTDETNVGGDTGQENYEEILNGLAGAGETTTAPEISDDTAATTQVTSAPLNENIVGKTTDKDAAMFPSADTPTSGNSDTGAGGADIDDNVDIKEDADDDLIVGDNGSGEINDDADTDDDLIVGDNGSGEINDDADTDDDTTVGGDGVFETDDDADTDDDLIVGDNGDFETDDDADIADDDVAVGDEIDPVDDDVDDDVSNDSDDTFSDEDDDDVVEDSDEVSDEVLTSSTDTDGRFPTLGAFADFLGEDYKLTLSIDREKFEKALKLGSSAKSLKEATYPGSYNAVAGWSESGGYDFEIMMPLMGECIVVYIDYNDGRPRDWLLFDVTDEQWDAFDSVFRLPPSYEECTIGKVAAYLDGYLTNAEATVETTIITDGGETWNTLTLDKKKTAKLLERAAALDFDISGDMYAVADTSTVSVSIVDRSSRCGILISLWDYAGYDVLKVQYGDRLRSDGTMSNRYYCAPMNIPDGSFETLYEIFTGEKAPDGRILTENKRPDIDADESDIDSDEPEFEDDVPITEIDDVAEDETDD